MECVTLNAGGIKIFIGEQGLPVRSYAVIVDAFAEADAETQTGASAQN